MFLGAVLLTFSLQDCIHSWSNLCTCFPSKFLQNMYSCLARNVLVLLNEKIQHLSPEFLLREDLSDPPPKGTPAISVKFFSWSYQEWCGIKRTFEQTPFVPLGGGGFLVELLVEENTRALGVILIWTYHSMFLRCPLEFYLILEQRLPQQRWARIDNPKSSKCEDKQMNMFWSLALFKYDHIMNTRSFCRVPCPK